MKRVLFTVLSLSIASAQAELMVKGTLSDPSYFNAVSGMTMIRELAILPTTGHLTDDRLAWSETYWPHNKGGIAYRWNHPDPQPFKYRLHTKEELLKMSPEQLGQLSPSELYDISKGDYNYTLTNQILKVYAKPGDLWWEGICHGWALAASL